MIELGSKIPMDPHAMWMVPNVHPMTLADQVTRVRRNISSWLPLFWYDGWE